MAPASTIDLQLDLETMLRNMTLQQRLVVELRLQGYRVREAARHLHVSISTVERALADARARIQQKILGICEGSEPPQALPIQSRAEPRAS